MLLFWIHSGAQSDFIAVVQALLFLLAGGTTEQCVTQFIGTTFDPDCARHLGPYYVLD